MGVGGGKFVGARAKVRRCVEEGAQRRVSGGGYGLALVWVVAGEGVLRWVRGGEDVWRKVCCGGCAGAKMCGGRCAAADAGVWVWKDASTHIRGRRCAAEGDWGWLWLGIGVGCGRRRGATEGARVWRCVEEGALFGVRWCGDVWRKVRYGGGRAYGCGRAQVRSTVGGGVERWGCT